EELAAKDVLAGFALRDFAPPRIDVHDLERHAPEWGRLVPPSARMRAVIFHILAEKYRLAEYHIPNIRAALSLDDADVQEADQEESGAPIPRALSGSRSTHREGSSADPSVASEDLLAESAEWLFVPGGSIVTQQGDPMDSLIVVASGRLRVS